MSDAKYAAAKELIQQKHYSAARAILETVDEPKAAGWLAKLNRIAPLVPPAPPASRRSLLPWAVAGIALVLAVIGWAFVLRGMPANVSGANSASAEVQRMVAAYCAYPIHSDRGCDPSTFNEPATQKQIHSCFTASGQGQDVRLFINCMLRAEMFGSIGPITIPTPDYSGLPTPNGEGVISLDLLDLLTTDVPSGP